MFRPFTIAATIALLSVFVSAANAFGDAEGRTRVTIRGTGSGVRIERTEAPAAAPPESAVGVYGPLDEAVDMKAGGASDSRLIAYLRERQAELPPIIEARDVRRLRRAGAGRSVVAYLATVAAVDIGETGEGYEAAVSAAPSPGSELEAAPYDVPYAYPLAGGYGAPYPSRFARRGFHGHVFPRASRRVPPFVRPFFHRAIPPRVGLSRLPMAP